MQPIKGFNLEAAKQEAAKEDVGKANILKTHRFISDLHDEEMHHLLGSSDEVDSNKV